jgi:iron complex transport system ATP-binding protein
MEHFFELEDFGCGYDTGFKISEINFSLIKGTFAGIIGPNGSGKTTLFKGITGDIKSSNGNVLLNGKKLSSFTNKEKAQKIAIVTQSVEIWDINVEDYVLMGRLPYHSQFRFFETKEDIEIAEKYMNLTGINHLRHKNMSELSGGEQQLVSIARALTQEPQLLLLDEPTSHLDITHQVEVLNLIQRLNEQLGLAVLMIIHDLNLAGEYCNYLIMLNNGKIHIKGRPENVLNYQTIEDVYKTVVITRTNPISNKPVVFLVSEKVLKKI